MTDTTIADVRPEDDTKPCVKCHSMDHTTAGHVDGGEPLTVNGHVDGGSAPVTVQGHVDGGTPQK
jgi:hypothetical protein